MSRIFWYYLLSHYVLFIILYYLFVCIACLWSLLLGGNDFQNLQRVRWERIWAASGTARQVNLDHFNPMCFLSLVHILAFLHQYCYNPHTLGIWVHSWLVMLRYVVMNVVQLFHSLWCWVWVVSLWEFCGLPFVEMWFGCARIDIVVWVMFEMTCGA
jgi:hypothetical protein